MYKCKPAYSFPVLHFRSTAPQKTVSTQSSTARTAETSSTHSPAAHSTPVSCPVLHTPASKPSHIYCYGNHHRPGNTCRRPSNRRWSNTRHISIAKETDAESKSKPSADTSSVSTATVRGEGKKKEKKASSTVHTDSSVTRRTLNNQQKVRVATPPTTTEEVTTPTSSRSQSHTTCRRLGTGSGSRYKWRRRSISSSEWVGWKGYIQYKVMTCI